MNNFIYLFYYASSISLAEKRGNKSYRYQSLFMVDTNIGAFLIQHPPIKDTMCFQSRPQQIVGRRKDINELYFTTEENGDTDRV